MNRKRDYDIPDVTHKDLISCDWACAWTGGAGCSATLLLPSYLLCQRREGFRVQKQNKNWQMFWFASLPKNECSWTPNSSLFISRRASRWKWNLNKSNQPLHMGSILLLSFSGHWKKLPSFSCQAELLLAVGFPGSVQLWEVLLPWSSTWYCLRTSCWWPAQPYPTSYSVPLPSLLPVKVVLGARNLNVVQELPGFLAVFLLLCCAMVSEQLLPSSQSLFPPCGSVWWSNWIHTNVQSFYKSAPPALAGWF